jgi:hypothetical protein
MEFHYSKAKLVGMQLGLLLIIVFFLYMNLTIFTTDPLMNGCGWLVIVSITVIVIMAVSRLFNFEPQIVINSRGIHDRRKNLGLIPWDNIQTIYIKSSYIRFREFKYYYMFIETKNAGSYRSRIPREKMGSSGANSPFAISFQFLKPSVNDAIVFIEAQHPGKIKDRSD